MSQNYIIVNGELYHHGVKGQKWGVRRYQNPDGTLTRAGKRRQKALDKDAAKLSKEFGKHLDDYVNADRSRTHYYHVDEKGNNSYRSDGKGYFDTSRGFDVIDAKKTAISSASKRKYESLRDMMRRKYDDVISKANYEPDTGKAYVEVTMKKWGLTTVSRIEKEYGEWELPMKFITYAQDKKS